MEEVMSDLGGAYSAVLVYIGDKLGLYKGYERCREPSNLTRIGYYYD
jgi:hypothetical protein